MRFRTVFLVLFISFLNLSISAQKKIYLQNRKHLQKVKQLDLNESYTFITNSGIYYDCSILSFNDSLLYIADKGWVKRSTLPIKNIRIIKNHISKDWHGAWEAGVIIGMCSTIGLIEVPVGSLQHNEKNVAQGKISFVFFGTIAATAIIAATYETKYDLTKNWEIIEK